MAKYRSKQWFLDRVGKQIVRDPDFESTRPFTEEVFCKDYAECLFESQNHGDEWESPNFRDYTWWRRLLFWIVNLALKLI